MRCSENITLLISIIHFHVSYDLENDVKNSINIINIKKIYLKKNDYPWLCK